MSNSSNARQKNKYEFVADGVYIFKRFDKKYVDSRGLYQLYAYYDGQNYRRSLKTVDRAIALERAFEEFQKIRKRILLGQSIKRTSFEFLCDEYLKARKALISKKTPEQDWVSDYHRLIVEAYYRRYFQKEMKLNDLSKLSDLMVDDYLNWRRYDQKFKKGKLKAPPTAKTLNRERVVFIALMDFAIKKQWIIPDDVPKFPWQKQLPSEDKPFTAFSRLAYNSLRAHSRWASYYDQKNTALQKEDREMAYLLKEYILFMVNTGIRPGKETRERKWGHVNFSNKTLLIVRGKTRPRTIPLFPTAQEVLLRMHKRASAHCLENDKKLHSDDYVWKYLDACEPIYSFAKPFKAFLKRHSDPKKVKTPLKDLKSDLSSYSPYSLRHTFATMGIEREVSADLLMKCMGTGPRPFHNSYNQVMPESVRNQLLKGLITEKPTQV